MQLPATLGLHRLASNGFGSCCAIRGRELAELDYRGGHDFERESDVSGSSLPAETEADGCASIFGRQADRGEDMGRFDGSGGAGGSSGAGESL